jgi:type VI secretion-associated protein, VC_A0118 family
MSIIGLLPLLLAGSTATPLDMVHWQQCRDETAPLARLACYDSLGDKEVSTSEPAAIHSSTWQAIWAQEQRRTSDSSPFLLQQDVDRGSAILTRPALRGATLAIGCVDSITHIRLRLDSPWRGNQVQIALDGQFDERPQSWFIRDQGLLLEYGRGLPAIEELKRWLGHHELQVRSDHDVPLRIDLGGLKEALSPLRQLCRW